MEELSPKQRRARREAQIGLWVLVPVCALLYGTLLPCCYGSTGGPGGYLALFMGAYILAKLERLQRPGRIAYRCFIVLLACLFVYQFWADFWIDSGVVDWMRRREEAK